MKKLLAPAVLAGVLATQAVPAHAMQCQIVGRDVCLNALMNVIKSQSFVEAWANNTYQLYATRNCQGGPSITGTYTFWGESVNPQDQLVDNLIPNISCQECDARSKISGLVSDGYLGECSPSTDKGWNWSSQFCGFAFNISLYDAAYYFTHCFKGTYSACSTSGGCLK